MKAKTISVTMLALLPAALLTLTSCSSAPKPPPPVGSARMSYTEGVPGGVIVQTFKTTATVTAIDQAKRLATLAGPDGKKFAVQVSAEVTNFDQIHVGDQVIATVTQKIVARIEKEGSKEVSDVAAETIQVTARIISIDPEKRTVTLRFDNGNTETRPIRDDVDLGRHKVGELVVFRVTEMIAIRLEKR